MGRTPVVDLCSLIIMIQAAFVVAGITGCGTESEIGSSCAFKHHSSTSFTEIIGIEIDHPYFYVVGRNDFAVFDVSSISDPQIVSGNPNALTYAEDAQFVGDVLYVLEENAIIVLDVSTPTLDPEVIDEIDLGLELSKMGDLTRMIRFPNSFVITEDRFVPNNDDGTPLYVFNDGESGVQSHSIGDGHFTVLERHNDYLYAGFTFHNDLKATAFLTIDASDLSQPTIVSELETDSAVTAIAIHEDLLYATIGSRLNIFSLADPKEPAKLGELTDQFIASQRLAVSGIYAYAGAGDRLNVINISNPADPLSVHVEEFSWCKNVDEGDIDQCYMGDMVIGSDASNSDFIIIGRQQDIWLMSTCNL